MTKYSENEILKIARVLDKEIWDTDLPMMTRSATIEFHARRQASTTKAIEILDAINQD